MMTDDDELLRDKNGKLILFADGSPIPHAAFENEPSDTYLNIYSSLSRKERVEMMINIGIPVPQWLLDEVKDSSEDVDKT